MPPGLNMGNPVQYSIHAISFFWNLISTEKCLIKFTKGMIEPEDGYQVSPVYQWVIWKSMGKLYLEF